MARVIIDGRRFDTAQALQTWLFPATSDVVGGIFVSTKNTWYAIVGRTATILPGGAPEAIERYGALMAPGQPALMAAVSATEWE